MLIPNITVYALHMKFNFSFSRAHKIENCTIRPITFNHILLLREGDGHFGFVHFAHPLPCKSPVLKQICFSVGVFTQFRRMLDRCHHFSFIRKRGYINWESASLVAADTKHLTTIKSASLSAFPIIAKITFLRILLACQWGHDPCLP